jgi:ElaB/YqjD/DUF883 family membrane-anchored ribosome-binding protein
MTTAVARAVFEEASEEVRALAARAGEVAEEGVHLAKRTVRTAQRRAEDAANDAATCIRQQPLTAVSVAVGAGLAIGAAGAFFAAAIASCRAARKT